jgi:hypothetical protein
MEGRKLGMNTGALGAALVALVLGSGGLAAQQPKPHARQHMQMMDSMNARLDSLVDRMNRASGNAKVTVMAQVINELVAQRRAMHQHMRQMMQSHGTMMGPNRTMKPDRGAAPAERSGPAVPGADTSNHAEHPPE